MAERQIAAVFMAAGAEGVTLPSYEQARADFDADLTAVPEVLDRDQMDLRRALGLVA